MNYAAFKLEFSPDPLSDASPSWVDVTRFVVGQASWSGGKARDLDDPQAGGASFTLKSPNREFEPDYAAGVYYPNIRPLRRFRISLVSGGVTTREGTYYATSWTPGYPAGTTYLEVAVTCVDGFGLLSLDLLPMLDPPDAQTVADVLSFDSPLALYPLGDPHGSKMKAASGPDGTYHAVALMAEPAIVPGSADTSVEFDGTLSRGAAPIADVGWFFDSNEFTCEAVCQYVSGGDRYLALGPFNTFHLAHIFNIFTAGFSFFGQTGNVTLPFSTAINDGDVHHVALTWDGNTLIAYIDGAVDTTYSGVAGVQISQADAGENLYVGGAHQTGFGGSGVWLEQYAAFYDDALSADRIAAHADACLNRGFYAESVGDRIAALATSTLWSTAGIASSAHTAAPLMDTNQAKLDQITAAADGEKPWGLFYFDGNGDPQYRGWDEWTDPAATFGDQGGEVRYTSFTPIYDDEIYNVVTASTQTGTAQTATDAASEAEFFPRGGADATGLPLELDSDAADVAQAIVDRFGQPSYRFDSISLNGANWGALSQILDREIGDTIRVRRRGTGGTPIDVITTILGKAKTMDTNGNLTCTWNLARGFNAADGCWHLGVAGFSELGVTTVLG